MVRVVRRLLGWALRRLRSVPEWRSWTRRFRPVYRIREATLGDLEVIDGLATSSEDPGPSASGQGVAPNLTVYVAERGTTIIGSVRLMRHGDSDSPHAGYWLYSLEVEFPYRALGVGEALTMRVIDQARAEHAPGLFLRVFEDNAPALALYRKLGFEPVALPALADDLAADVRNYGRRRVPLRKSLKPMEPPLDRVDAGPPSAGAFIEGH